MELDNYQSYLINRAIGYLELAKYDHVTEKATRFFVLNAILGLGNAQQLKHSSHIFGQDLLQFVKFFCRGQCLCHLPELSN